LFRLFNAYSFKQDHSYQFDYLFDILVDILVDILAFKFIYQNHVQKSWEEK